MSKAATWLLWCFVFVMPWDEFVELPLLGSIPHLIGIAASAAGVLHILARRTLRPLRWFHGFAGLFVLWAGASVFWSIDPEASESRFLTYLQLGVLVWLIWEIAPSSRQGRALLQAYVLGASVSAVAAVYNSLYGASVDPARFTALNANANDLGLVLVLGLPMAWYLGLSQWHRRAARLWHLYVPLGITAILLTASRGAFVAALVALAIIPWTLGPLRLRAKAVLAVLAVGSLVLGTRFVPEASLERVASTRADIASGHFGGRGVIWESGLRVAREHPLAGVGAGAFGAAVAATLGGYPRAAHDVFLSILVEEGIVGLCLFLAMTAAALSRLRHLSALQRRFSIVLLAALAVGSLSLSWSARKPFWFVLALVATQVAPRPARRPTPSGGRGVFSGDGVESLAAAPRPC
jgi:O-antigen ligase